MGCFDTLLVTCPNCRQYDLSFQSKGGDCQLTNYTLETVPVDVLGDCINDVIVCAFCNTTIGLKAQVLVYPYILKEENETSTKNH